MKIRTALVIAMLTLPTFAFAKAQSSTIDLGGAVAAPGKEAVIDLNKLLEGVNYVVNCTVRSNDVSKQPFDMVQLSTDQIMITPSFTLNNTDVGVNNQAKLPATADVSLQATNVQRLSGGMVQDFYMTLRNLDDTDTITLSNCYANPA